MDIEHKLRFIRRLGGRVDGADARPILLGLKFTADMELVLDRSWMLSQCNNQAARDINIVRDLTAKQRQREADMVTEASRKNLERIQEEIDQNIVYKVVGRKGEKREIKVALRQGEVLGSDGKVIRREDWARGTRRGDNRPPRTGGKTEPLGKARTAVASETPQPAMKTPEQEEEKALEMVLGRWWEGLCKL